MTQQITTQEAAREYENIIKEETKEVESLTNNFEKSIKPIVLRAAEKLSKHVDDPSQISAIICRAWPKKTHSWIREFIPEEYKRAYNSEMEEPKLDRIESFYDTAEKTLTEGVKVYKNLLKDYRDVLTSITADEENIKAGKPLTHEQKQEKILMFQNSILESFAVTVNFEDAFAELKQLYNELTKVADSQDRRAKIHEFHKVLLRIQMFFKNKSQVAKTAKLSSKWAKEGIEKDPAVQENFNKICQWLFKIGADEMVEWFAAAMIAESRDMPVPEPPVVLAIQKP